MSYKHNKTWRRNNRNKYQEQKKRYYDKTVSTFRKGKYTEEEMKFILEREDLTDTQISRFLQRSVASIQCKRCKLKSGIDKI